MREYALPDRKALEKKYLENSATYGAVLDAFKQEVQGLFQASAINPTIKGRVKSFDSYYRKVLKKLRERPGLDSLPAISDILGIRIICPFLENLKVTERMLREALQVLKVERKGYNVRVYEFGYESTHLMVRIPECILTTFHLKQELLCEVQLQTILQDAWSEVEHELIYKADFSPFDDPLRRKLAALNAMLTLSDTIFQEIRDYQNNLNEQLQNRRRTFSNQVQSAFSDIFRQSAHRDPKQENSSFVRGDDDIIIPRIPGTSIDDLLIAALTAHNSRRFSPAIELYTKILDLDPQNNIRSVILVHRGMAHFAKFDYQSALEDFSMAFEHDSTNCKALYCRGIVHILQKNYSMALSDFNRGIELDPFHIDLLLGRAQVLYQLGNYPEALSDCEAALRIEPHAEKLTAFRNLVIKYLE